MIFELKVEKIGESLGVILPTEVLTRLNCGEGETVLLVDGPGQNYYLTKTNSDDDKTMAAAKDIMDRYAGTLRELAKY